MHVFHDRFRRLDPRRHDFTFYPGIPTRADWFSSKIHDVGGADEPSPPFFRPNERYVAAR
jgi:hypothetical protein